MNADERIKDEAENIISIWGDRSGDNLQDILNEDDMTTDIINLVKMFVNLAAFERNKKGLKTIIAGSRDIGSQIARKYISQAVKDSGFNITEVVSGGARGIDHMGEMYAYGNSLDLKVFPANWNEHGKAAGPIRNQEMAKYADALIAIWDGKSRGTKNMINNAKKAGLEVFVYEVGL